MWQQKVGGDYDCRVSWVMSFGESSWNDVGDFDLELVLVENDRIRKQSLLLIYYELSESESLI